MRKQLPVVDVAETTRRRFEHGLGVMMMVDNAVRQADRDRVPVLAECRGSTVVVRPGDEKEVIRAMLWCGGANRSAPKRAVPLNLDQLREVPSVIAQRPLQCARSRRD